MRKLISALILPILFIPIAFGAVSWWNTNTSAPSKDPELHPFVIEPGLGASKIAKKLEEGKFIKSSLAFRIYVQLKDKADKIKAGDYRLSKNKPLASLIEELVRGPIAVWVTLPEGLRREEILQRVLSGIDPPERELSAFRNEFLRLTEGNEGFLFPDTYLFLKTATTKAVVEKLNSTFEKRVDEGIRKDAKKQNLTTTELVTLASIIERETRGEPERPVVAGILLKRLKIGMPLQADATLQYVIGSAKCEVRNAKCSWWEPVTAEDKTVKSPYNTYTNLGLPPGPIANPGLSSITAAANPEESDYLFYLHDREGKIHYAKTIDEHNQNIQKYLR